ncbi:MAG: hypothetical protein WD775_13965 [Burkholderiales bacterium]
MLRTVLFALVTGLLWPQFAAAAPVAVRFVEGVTHGFLVLRTLDGVPIASGDLLQAVRDGAVESRMVFRFKDGSLMDETVVFTQERVFVMQRYRLLQQGPAFDEDTEISLQRASGKYRVTAKARKGGEEEVVEGTLDMPADTYNGMVLNIAKNIPQGARETVHIVAFTPAARLVELEVTQAGEDKVLVGELAKSATHYVFKPRPGAWLTLLATLLGRMPPDSHAWIVTDEVPAFVRFEGPLHPAGPAWRIELTSPRWPD